MGTAVTLLPRQVSPFPTQMAHVFAFDLVADEQAERRIKLVRDDPFIGLKLPQPVDESFQQGDVWRWRFDEFWLFGNTRGTPIYGDAVEWQSF